MCDLLNTAVHFGSEQWVSKYDIVNENKYWSIVQLSSVIYWHDTTCFDVQFFSSKKWWAKRKFSACILESLIFFFNSLLIFFVNELMPNVSHVFLLFRLMQNKFEKFKRHNISFNLINCVQITTRNPVSENILWNSLLACRCVGKL